MRFGYAHVVNNIYEEWTQYAIGGSADPTILSEANYFIAPNNVAAKQVNIKKITVKLIHSNIVVYISLLINSINEYVCVFVCEMLCNRLRRGKRVKTGISGDGGRTRTNS